jgi:2-keto-4-pentenoate hydratase/2-oxohepta-3-ene-1,7-dioic acid hydratase in catechol pathway
MIYNCYQQVAHPSQAFTLEPGEVIATGTPAQRSPTASRPGT